MDDCIFCLIAEGKIPSSKIMETKTLYAFLDLHPVNKGHALIIPKKHVKDILGVDPELGRDVFQAMQRIGKALMTVTGAQGFNVLQNNGRAAGQEVDHLHWHIIPRFANDGFKLWAQGDYASQDEMNQFAEDIRKQLA